MRTPSLRAPIVLAGVAVTAAVLVALDVFVYLNLQRDLERNLDDLLATRARLATLEASNRTPSQLADRLTALGLRATVRSPEGAVFRAEPPSPGLDTNLPPTAGQAAGSAQESLQVALPDGTAVTVYARRTGVDRALRRLLVLEITGSATALAAAAVLLVFVADTALRPLGHVAAVARRRAAGHTGERLLPDRPRSKIGQMATAYDAMLDELETTLAEARAAEARSRRMEERSRQIIETATDAFVSIDMAGAVVDWNEGAERLLGWTAAEIAGKDVFETMFPPALRAEHRARLERLRATGERRRRGRRIETVAVGRDGSTRAVELVLWATFETEKPTVNAFVHDLTARRQAETAVHRLAAIVESTDDAVVGTDLGGIVTSWNPAAERMYGYTEDEMVGQPIVRIVPPDHQDEIDHALQAVRAGNAVSNHESVRLPKHGPPIDVAITISPMRDASGRVVGASAIGRDITEQRWLATTLDSTLSALEAAVGEARVAEELSRRFLADAAHQLRTPIAGIRACAETLLRGTAGEERDQLLANLVREASRASRLMTSLLQIARLDQGQGQLPVSCDLAQLCQDEVERARLLSPDLQVTLRVAGARRIDADPNAVREIVANLLDNARRHAVARVEVSVRPIEDGLEILVGDDGPGVPAGMEERIFERFVTLDDRGGSGLGLAIARQLARAGGGDLRYEDGAFVFRLPTLVSATEPVAASSGPPAQPLPQELS